MHKRFVAPRADAMLSLAPTTRPTPSGRNSVVECLLPKQKVVGSNPIARSIISFRVEIE